MISYYIIWDHTNPPHPHHHPSYKFKLECIKCNNSLNARKTELSSLQFKSFRFIKSDVLVGWGWGGFVWPLIISYYINNSMYIYIYIYIMCNNNKISYNIIM